MLYPIDSETREVRELPGIWEFQLDPDNAGLNERWFAQPRLPGETLPMPVPASYNDITTEACVRDHIGPVWYRRTFFAPAAWRERRVALRVGAASHRATVWINGREICQHKGGFLPFQGEADAALNFGANNSIVVRVDNILDWTTLPPGEVVTQPGRPPYPAGHKVQLSYHDFYNYNGIHRPVRLVVTPHGGIEDITVRHELDATTGAARMHVRVLQGAECCRISLIDTEGVTCASADGNDATLIIANPKLWAPGAPYLYNLKVETFAKNGAPVDVYYLPTGIRTITVTDSQFLINGKPFYFKGFGKHEDSDIRGKGLDEALNQRDFYLLKWINANSFRTSHYPYSEEIMRMADREGIAVIDEVPAVGLYFFNDEELPAKSVFIPERAGDGLRAHHKDCVRELIARDKNHACVVMWSLGNETATHEDAGYEHYKSVAGLARELDPTRPLTIVEYNFPWFTKVAGLVDVISFNRYFGWYMDTASLGAAELKLKNEIGEWRRRWPKPLLVAEYGADTIAGCHALPPRMFTEEFQVDFLDTYHRVLDQYPFIIGGHPWCFADFQTKQGITRFDGNKKGVFTRQRNPKAAAHYLKKYWKNK